MLSLIIWSQLSPTLVGILFFIEAMTTACTSPRSFWILSSRPINSHLKTNIYTVRFANTKCHFPPWFPTQPPHEFHASESWIMWAHCPGLITFQLGPIAYWVWPIVKLFCEAHILNTCVRLIGPILLNFMGWTIAKWGAEESAPVLHMCKTTSLWLHIQHFTWARLTHSKGNLSLLHLNILGLTFCVRQMY